MFAGAVLHHLHVGSFDLGGPTLQKRPLLLGDRHAGGDGVGEEVPVAVGLFPDSFN
jgi:hypothetical protein